MKITFENDKEKECLSHILFDWFMHNGQWDTLGCEPACRDESSPGCDFCIQRQINHQLDNNYLNFNSFGGEEYLTEYGIFKWANIQNKEKVVENAIN